MEKEEMNLADEKNAAMELPEPKISPKMLYDVVFESDKPQVLKHGIDFKVFDHLSEPIYAEEVAQKLDTKPEPTSRLLDMLVIMGMVEKTQGQYVNTPMAEEFLVTGKPTYVGDFVLTCFEQYAQMVAQIPQSLKNGITSQAPTEDYWASDVDMIIRMQRAMWTSKFLLDVLEMPEFPSFKRMLDLAGNVGIFTVALISRHPTLKAVVFDQPSVIETTKKIIAEYGLQDRIGVLAGDFTRDDIGKDYDLVWTSDTLNFFPDKNALEEVCKNVHNSMNPGGVFISQQQMVISKNRIWPPDTAWFSHIMALAGFDCTVYETDISEAMLKAGFKSVESRYVEYANGTNQVHIARKEEKR